MNFPESRECALPSRRWGGWLLFCCVTPAMTNCYPRGPHRNPTLFLCWTLLLKLIPCTQPPLMLPLELDCIHRVDECFCLRCCPCLQQACSIPRRVVLGRSQRLAGEGKEGTVNCRKKTFCEAPPPPRPDLFTMRVQCCGGELENSVARWPYHLEPSHFQRNGNLPDPSGDTSVSSSP